MAKMAEWAKRFESLASPQFKGALTKEMSRETLAFIEEGFRTESTPYGQKWRPKKIPNGQQILVEKDKMRRRFFARVGLGSFSIKNAQPYYPTHQFGAPSRNIPRRQMVPDANRLPIKWIRTYGKVFTRRTWALIKKGKKK
jgi:phage gpG-like protein